MTGVYKLDCPDCPDREKGLRPDGKGGLVCLDRGHSYPDPRGDRLPETTSWTLVHEKPSLVTECSDWPSGWPDACPSCGRSWPGHMLTARNEKGELVAWEGICGAYKIVILND